MSNELNIRLFATLRDKAGLRSINVPLTEPTAVKDMLDTIAAAHPKLAATLPTTLVAVNRTYAERTTIINPGDEVALFPPVSGG